MEYQGILFLARHGKRQGFNLLEDSGLFLVLAPGLGLAVFPASQSHRDH